MKKTIKEKIKKFIGISDSDLQLPRYKNLVFPSEYSSEAEQLYLSCSTGDIIWKFESGNSCYNPNGDDISDKEFIIDIEENDELETILNEELDSYFDNKIKRFEAMLPELKSEQIKSLVFRDRKTNRVSSEYLASVGCSGDITQSFIMENKSKKKIREDKKMFKEMNNLLNKLKQ